jgi:integrase
MGKRWRRQAGEGGISEYEIKAGRRFLIKYTVQREDGTKRVVLTRGFRSRRDAAAALRAEIRKTEVGEWVEPSKQRLDAYLAEWIQVQRLSPSTLSSYRKNIRLHIDPYLGGQLIARLTGSAVDAWMRKLEASGRADGQGGLSARTVRYVFTILRSALSYALGEERLPVIRLHDLRHTHATLLLTDGVPVKVVSERLSHASATITLTVYQHVHPGMGRQAADRFAALLKA